MNKISLEQQGFNGIFKVWSVVEKKLLIKSLNLQETTINDKQLSWQTKHLMNSAPLIQVVSKNEGSKRSDLEIDGFIDLKLGMIFQKIESEIKVEANVELILFFISHGLVIKIVLFGLMNGFNMILSVFESNSLFQF